MSQPVIAYHFDMKRAMWTRAYLDAMVDRLKAWGFNAVLYELEDKFRFANHPAIVHQDAFSPADTADFVASARAKGMDVIPLVQSLGHAEYVVGKPAYAHLRETPEVVEQYDPLAPQAKALILELFDDVIDAFQPRELFHMGGDETWSLGKSAKCAETVARIGTGGLYLQHMLPLFAHLRAKRLRPVIWADVALTHPEMIGEIPADVVLMDWDYWTTAERPAMINVWAHDPATGRPCSEVTWDHYDQVVPPAFKQRLQPHVVDEQTRRDGTFRGFGYTDALKAMGFDVITAPANRSYSDMIGIPNYPRHLPNCFFAARKARGGYGVTVTSWAVRHNHPETTVLSTYAAVRALRDDAPFNPAALGRDFARDFYGAECGDFTRLAMQAAAGLDCTREFGIREMQNHLDRGEDPIAVKTALLLDEYDGAAGALAAIDALRDGYLEAREAFLALQQAARRNARNLDFWLEGIDLNSFYLEVMRAAVAGELPGRQTDLLVRMEDIRDRTRQLFRETYPPASVEEELRLRYGLHDHLLRQTATVG